MRLSRSTYYFLLITVFCLYSHASLSDGGLLFSVSATYKTLTISSSIPNHVYSNAGIKINTAGYSLPNAGSECTPASNGYCLFSTSNTNSTSITIAGTAGMISISLCLNGTGAISCQDYTLQLTEPPVQHNIIYIGNSNGDVQYSNNNGNSWATTLTQPDGSQVDGISVTTNGTIYAGTAHNVEISSNHGTTWSATTPPDVIFGTDSLFLANGPLYVSSAQEVKISYDNGVSWNTTSTNPDGSTVWSIFVASTTIYTGTDNGNVVISTDNGNSWTPTPAQPDGSSVHGIFVTHNGATTIYAGTSDGNVEVSTDGGTTWQATPTQPDGCAVNGLVVTSNGSLYVASGCGEVMVSTNQGLSWAATAAAPSSAVFCIYVKE